MKTLIVYASSHGCAEECAHKLEDEYSGDIDIVNIKDRSNFDLSQYSTVVVGGSIHAGKIQKRIRTFCEKNMNTLLEKKLGLFLCCMEEGENAQKQFDNAYPAELRAHAGATGLFGGAFRFERMNFIERFMIKKIAKIDKSVSKISDERIAEFAAKMS